MSRAAGPRGPGIEYTGGDGGGNIDLDPQFWNMLEDNLRLLPDSPAIDAGNNAHLPPGVITDLDGQPRIFGGTVDMGAYESQAPDPPNPIFVDRSAAGAGDGDELARRPHRPELCPALGERRHSPRRLDHRRGAGGGRASTRRP